jgi:alkanesulfonate monooxygenase SsuD/methylene tetrahydromethanopterin reductase-like flavin-dependent oxidoreductase (luciferase family)
VTVACTSFATVELAAARGLPMLLGIQLDDTNKIAMLDHYTQAARAAGREPSGVPHVSTVLAQVADSRDLAVAELRAAMPGWLADGLAGYQPIDGRPHPRRDPRQYTDLLCDLHPVGTPDECVARLRASSERTGIRHVIMMVEGAGSRAATLANIARLGAGVLPRLRD